MGAHYSASVSGTALSTTVDLRTLVTAATGVGSVIALRELSLSGEASASAFARVVVNRPSGAPSTTKTEPALIKMHPASAAATFTVGHTWNSAEATLAATDVLVPGFNAFGGVYHWIAAPGHEVVVGAQGAVAYLCIRSRSGTSTVSGHFIIEER